MMMETWETWRLQLFRLFSLCSTQISPRSGESGDSGAPTTQFKGVHMQTASLRHPIVAFLLAAPSFEMWGNHHTLPRPLSEWENQKDSVIQVKKARNLCTDAALSSLLWLDVKRHGTVWRREALWRLYSPWVLLLARDGCMTCVLMTIMTYDNFNYTCTRQRETQWPVTTGQKWKHANHIYRWRCVNREKRGISTEPLVSDTKTFAWSEGHWDICIQF